MTRAVRVRGAAGAFAVSLLGSILSPSPARAAEPAHATPPAPPQATPAPGPDFRDLEAAIWKEIAVGTIPSAALAVARNGQIVYERAFGLADREGKVAATVHTPYPLASATKPIVATALMILVERGKVDLDAPALRYLHAARGGDGAPALLGAYTVRQLLNHTSGLGTYAAISYGPQAGTGPGLVERLRHYGFAAQAPGVVSEYSNLGYGLLGAIVADQGGGSLPGFLAKEVFGPLGMGDSRLVDSPATPPGGAQKYDAAGTRIEPSYNDTPGAGNAWASVHDFVRFGMFHLSPETRGADAILRPESKRRMRSTIEPGAYYPYYGNASYGLGWYFRATNGEPALVWHEGGMPGASTILVLLPRQGIVASVLINATDKNDVAHGWANRLLQTLDPTYTPAAFEATEGMRPYGAEPEWSGRWEGSVRIDEQEISCALTFAGGGKIQVEFPGRKADDLLPAQATFGGLLSGDLLLATLPATLPAHDVVQKPGGYVLLRLLRRGDQLRGTMIAYASPERLEHLFPFAVSLKKKGE
jgi:CubicO group peptidase (beta-lactamase class C family)